jgi:hypothetical protein
MIVGTMRKRLPFIAGSWKYGDRSGELMFDRVPFGVSDFLIPSSKLKDQAIEQTGATDLSSVLPMASAWNVNHASYAKRLYRASVPSGTDMSLPDVWGDVRTVRARSARIQIVSLSHGISLTRHARTHRYDMVREHGISSWRRIFVWVYSEVCLIFARSQ